MGRAESQRELDVYGLVFHSGRWYATGFDRGREDVRTFRLDRIGAVRPSEGTFVVPADFDATTQVVSGIAAVPWAYEVTVVLHVTLAEAAERLRKSVGRLTEHPDGVLLEARAEHLDGMARMLAGLGWEFEVIAPEPLRHELFSLGTRLRSSARSTVRSPECAHVEARLWSRGLAQTRLASTADRLDRGSGS